MKKLTASISAIGCWGNGFSNWQELSDLLKGKEVSEAGVNAATDAAGKNTARGPKPEIIPANERRRAPLPVRLAVETSWQATQASGLEIKELACVFVSGLGDTQLTDYMCKVLATEQKMLSPTKFHNSVHNAAAGYWTISTGCMKAANSVAGFEESVSIALLEAMIQCNHDNEPVLITFYDAPTAEIQKSAFSNANTQPLSVSLIIEPAIEPTSDDSVQENSCLPLLEMQVMSEPAIWPEVALLGTLQECYQQNPSAKIFALLKILTEEKKRIVDMPLSEGTSLQLSINF